MGWGEVVVPTNLVVGLVTNYQSWGRVGGKLPILEENIKRLYIWRQHVKVSRPLRTF